MPKDRPTRKKTIRRRIAISILTVLVSIITISTILLYSTGTIKPKYYNVTAMAEYKIMMPKETMKLNVSYDKKPSFGIDGQVTYTSTDESIVTVSEDGTIEAIKAGEAEIHVLIEGELYTTYRIQVVKPKVEDIETVLGSFSGEYDSHHYIDATVIMNIDRAEEKKISYASSNEQVATVSEEGIIHIVGVGESYITVTAGKVERTIVVQGVPKIELITLEGLIDGQVMLEADESFTIKLNAEIQPSSAQIGDDITYSIRDEDVAWLSGNTITAVDSGSTTLEVTVNGESYYFLVTVLEKASVTDAYIRETSSGEVINYLSLCIGESSQIYADFNYYPTTVKAPSVTYSVEDEYSHIVKVSNDGVVTILAEGEAEIKIMIGDYVMYLSVEGEKLPISEFSVSNLKATYQSDNMYELTWSPIEGYENAEYVIYRDGEVYAYTDDLYYDIYVPDWANEIDVYVRARDYYDISEPSREITLYDKVKEEQEDSSDDYDDTDDYSDVDDATESDDSEEEWLEIYE